MNIQIINTIIIGSFGRNTRAPLKTAATRLFVASLTALTLGIITGRIILRSPLPTNLPNSVIFALLSLISFLILGLVCMTLSANWTSGQNKLQAVMSVLPLRKADIVIMQSLPYLIILGLICLFCAPVIICMARAMQFNWLLGTFAILFGSVAGASLNFIKKPDLFGFRPAMFFAILASCLWLVDYSYKTQSDKIAYLMVLLISIAYLGLWQLILFTSNPQVNKSIKKAKLHLPKKLQFAFWYHMKILRNRRTLGSFIFCLSLSILTSVLIIKKQLMSGSSSLGLMMLIAVLATAFACDVRGIVRRNKPPEVEGMNGLHYFIKSEIIPSLTIGAVIGLPFLVAAELSHTLRVTEYLSYFAGLQFFAILVGLLASSIFVPQNGDLGPQFFASVFAISCLLAPSRIGTFSDQSIINQAIIWFLSGLICLVLIILIEQQRRLRYGHA